MSLEITKRIILNTDNTTPNSRVIIKQGCVNTVKLIVTINDKGGQLQLPVGTTAKVRMLKPDKNQVLNDCTVNGNEVIVTITEQMQAAAGTGYCEVILLYGNKILTTATFPVTIERNVHDDSQLESLPEYTSLINAIVAVDGKLGKTDNTANNTVTFSEASTDTDIKSGEKHSVIFGKLLKSIKTLRTGKVDKASIVNTDTVNDTTKIASAAVTYALGQEIDVLNNNLFKQIGRISLTFVSTTEFSGTMTIPSGCTVCLLGLEDYSAGKLTTRVTYSISGTTLTIKATGQSYASSNAVIVSYAVK